MANNKLLLAFTLIELLISIGLIGILASMVILAVNPAEQIRKAFGAEKTHSANQLQKAMAQFMIDYQNLPGDKAISSDFNSPTDICALGKTAAGCTNVDELIPKYLGCIPYDESDPVAENSGYEVYTQNGFIRVLAKYNDTESSGETGCQEPPVPVAYWKMDESDVTDDLEDSGANSFTLTTANITSPQGPSTNTPSTKFRNLHSWSFDGTEDYASVAHDAEFNLRESLTLMAWVLPTSLSSADTVNSIIRKGEANPNMWQLAIEDGFVTLMLENGDGVNGRVQGSTLLSTDNWYHVAATWDGATASVYLNGNLDGTNSYTGSNGGLLATDSRPIYVGGRSGTDNFSGQLDEVRVYNTALSAIQILKIASGWEYN